LAVQLDETPKPLGRSTRAQDMSLKAAAPGFYVSGGNSLVLCGSIEAITGRQCHLYGVERLVTVTRRCLPMPCNRLIEASDSAFTCVLGTFGERLYGEVRPASLVVLS
jgi:hypothetical protein